MPNLQWNGTVASMALDKAEALGVRFYPAVNTNLSDDEWHNPLQQDSYDTYTFGRIESHNVVLACLPTGVTGTISAAKVATNMLSSFQWMRFVLMVGIGGGVPSVGNNIRLGDVVVSKPTGAFGGVIQYDFGQQCSLVQIR